MRAKQAWALVEKSGRIDVENIRLKKSDVQISIYDEDTGAKVRRVLVTVVPTTKGRRS